MSQQGPWPLAELGSLPAGHHGLSPEEVTRSQRERLLAAMVRLVDADGYRASTVSEIVRLAAVSNEVFYTNFTDKEACFVAALETVAAHLEELVRGKLAADSPWASAVAEALLTVTRFFDEHRDLARVCLASPLGASPAAASYFHQQIDLLIPALYPGRDLTPFGALLPEGIEADLLGGVARGLARGAQESIDSLEQIYPALLALLLVPFIGPEAAADAAAPFANS